MEDNTSKVEPGALARKSNLDVPTLVKELAYLATALHSAQQPGVFDAGSSDGRSTAQTNHDDVLNVLSLVDPERNRVNDQSGASEKHVDELSQLRVMNPVTLRFHDPRLEIMFYEYLYKQNGNKAWTSKNNLDLHGIIASSKFRFLLFLAFFSIAALAINSPLEPGVGEIRVTESQLAAWSACLGTVLFFRLMFLVTKRCRFPYEHGQTHQSDLTRDPSALASKVNRFSKIARYMYIMDFAVPIIICVLTSALVIIERTLAVPFMHVLTYRFGVNFAAFDQIQARFLEKMVGVLLSLIIYNVSGLAQLAFVTENDIVSVDGADFDRSRSRLISNAIINFTVVFIVAGLAYNKERVQRRMFFGSLFAAVLTHESRRLRNVSSQLLAAQLPHFAHPDDSNKPSAAASSMDSTHVVIQPGPQAVAPADATDLSHIQLSSMSNDIWRAIQSHCTIVFCDVHLIANEDIAPNARLSLLNDAFSSIDNLAERFQVDKVRTLNGLWIGAAGLRNRNQSESAHASVESQTAHAGMVVSTSIHNAMKMCAACVNTVTTLPTSSAATAPKVMLTMGVATDRIIAGLLAGDRLEYQLFGDAVTEAQTLSTLRISCSSVCVSDGTMKWIDAATDFDGLSMFGKHRMPSTRLHGVSASHFVRFISTKDASSVPQSPMSSFEAAATIRSAKASYNHHKRDRSSYKLLGASRVAKSAFRGETVRPVKRLDAPSAAASGLKQSSMDVATSSDLSRNTNAADTVVVEVDTSPVKLAIQPQKSKLERLLTEYGLIDDEIQQQEHSQAQQGDEVSSSSSSSSAGGDAVLRAFAPSRVVFLAYCAFILSTMLAADADVWGDIGRLPISKAIIVLYSCILVLALVRCIFALPMLRAYWKVGVSTVDSAIVMLCMLCVMFLEAVRVGMLEVMPDETCGKFSRVTVWIIIPGVSFILTAIPLKLRTALFAASLGALSWVLASFIGAEIGSTISLPVNCPQPYPVWPRPVILILVLIYMLSVRISQEKLLSSMFILQRKLGRAQQQVSTQASKVVRGVQEVFSPLVLQLCLRALKDKFDQDVGKARRHVSLAVLDRPLGAPAAYNAVRLTPYLCLRGCQQINTTSSGMLQADSLVFTANDCVILSLDIVTLRNLSGLLDAEDTMAVLAAIIERIDNCIKEYGGQRANLLGTTLVATFGLGTATIPMTQLVFSALQAVAATFADLYTMSASFGIDLQVNGAIDVGPVSAGLIGRHHVSYQVIGAPVINADRLLRSIVGHSECAISHTAAAFLPANIRGHTNSRSVSTPVNAYLFTWSIELVYTVLSDQSTHISDVLRASRHGKQQLASAKIQYQDFKVLKGLGSGQFATVYLALHKPTRVPYAIKVIDAAQTKSRSLQAELKALSAPTTHPHLLEFFCALPGPGQHIWLLQEYIEGCTLEFLTDACTLLSERRCKLLIAQLVSAVGHLHQLGIIHRDIKPANIMITSTGSVKLIDLGLAALVTPFCPPGTSDRAAAEVHQAVDILSLLQSLTPGQTSKVLTRILVRAHQSSTLKGVVGACVLVDVATFDLSGSVSSDDTLRTALASRGLMMKRCADLEAATKYICDAAEGVIDVVVLHIRTVTLLDGTERWLQQMRNRLDEDGIHTVLAITCGPANFKAAQSQFASFPNVRLIRYVPENATPWIDDVVATAVKHSELTPYDPTAVQAYLTSSNTDLSVHASSADAGAADAAGGRSAPAPSFGKTGATTLTDTVSSVAGTPFAMAPEVSARRTCLASDWFAVGVTAFRCLAGCYPFVGETRKLVQRSIAQGSVQWDALPSSVSDEARSFLEALLQGDPAVRLGARGDAAEVLMHPFLADVSGTYDTQAIFTPDELKTTLAAMEAAEMMPPSAVAWNSAVQVDATASSTMGEDLLDRVSVDVGKSAQVSRVWQQFTQRLAFAVHQRTETSATRALSSSDEEDTSDED